MLTFLFRRRASQAALVADVVTIVTAEKSGTLQFLAIT